jgi:hypothetical protein
LPDQKNLNAQTNSGDCRDDPPAALADATLTPLGQRKTPWRERLPRGKPSEGGLPGREGHGAFSIFDGTGKIEMRE